MCNTQRSNDVFDVLAELPGPCQAVVRMRHKECVSNQEIARRMGVSLRQVETYLTHITTYLQDRLQHREFA